MHRLQALAAAIAILLVAAACGGATQTADQATGDQPTHDEATPHSHAEQGPDALPIVVSSAEPFPEGLIDTYANCMRALGYDWLPGQILMPDGSLHGISGPNRQPPPLSYRNDSFDCKARTGLDVAEAERGINDNRIDEERARRNSEEVIALVRCMTSQGWDMPEPVLDKVMGWLVLVHDPGPADRSAYDLELSDCYDHLAAESR